MNTTTNPEHMAVAALSTPPALPVGTTNAAALVLSEASMDKMMRLADLMASGRCTVPQHLQKSPGDCLAVVMQAMTWGMNPFAVAQKTHVSQSGALGYEAQLVSAVITGSGAVDGDPEYEFLGDWSKVLGKVEERKSDKGGKYYVATYTKADEAGLGVICRLRLRGEKEPREMEVFMSQCYPRFSTQWATDPKQQICYVAIRKWARRNKPGVILGVNTPEELDERAPRDMGMAEEVSQWNPALLIQAQQAAARGAKAYGNFWMGLTPETQANLVKTTEHADNKAAALVADRNRTIDDAPRNATAGATTAAAAKPAATEGPKVTFASVMERLVAAKTMDALDDAADWIGEVQDEVQRTELTTKYKALAAAMEGGAA